MASETVARNRAPSHSDNAAADQLLAVSLATGIQLGDVGTELAEYVGQIARRQVVIGETETILAIALAIG